MKKIIRQSVFETNSSSTHSITIAKSNDKNVLMDSLYVDDEGAVTINLMHEYGWEPEDFYDLDNKLCYMALYTIKYYLTDTINGKTLKEILEEVIMKQTGATKVNYNSLDDLGYIDHQSISEREYHFCFEKPEKLRQFIFNPNSYLHTDNDNY